MDTAHAAGTSNNENKENNRFDKDKVLGEP
jgi:hypothetical protein